MSWQEVVNGRSQEAWTTDLQNPSVAAPNICFTASTVFKTPDNVQKHCSLHSPHTKILCVWGSVQVAACIQPVAGKCHSLQGMHNKAIFVIQAAKEGVDVAI